MAFRSASTATYTFASGSTGSTVDLGATNNYRYINAINVYNKGKADSSSLPSSLTIECNSTNAKTFVPAYIARSYMYVTLVNTEGYLYLDNASTFMYINNDVTVEVANYSFTNKLGFMSKYGAGHMTFTGLKVPTSPALYFRLTNSDTYEVKVQTGIIVNGAQIVKSYVNGSYYNSSQDVMPLNNGVVSCRYNKTSTKYLSIIVNESCTVNGEHKVANTKIHDQLYSVPFDYLIIPD